MLRRFFILISTLLLVGCEISSPYKVSNEDSQKALSTELGTIIDVVPVRIKGKASNIGAIAGGLIGGIASEKVGSGTGQEIAIIAGTVTGGIVGYYSTVKLGEHNGFQYVISIDDDSNPIAVIQGQDKDKKLNFEIGDRVSIIYGAKVRLLPTAN
jgi:outer membrane lipoprotein SlyB